MIKTPKRRKRVTSIDSDSARKRRGITSEQMQGVPRITHLMNYTEGGIEHIIAALRFSGEQDAITFIKKYDSISKSDRECLSIEEICVAAEIDTRRMLTMAAAALIEYSLTITKLTVFSKVSEMLRKTVERGLTNEGTADRRLFFEVYAFIQAQEIAKQQAREFARQESSLRRIEGGPDQSSDLEAPRTTFESGKLLESPKEVRPLPPW